MPITWGSHLDFEWLNVYNRDHVVLRRLGFPRQSTSPLTTARFVHFVGGTPGPVGLAKVPRAQGPILDVRAPLGMVRRDMPILVLHSHDNPQFLRLQGYPHESRTRMISPQRPHGPTGSPPFRSRGSIDAMRRSGPPAALRPHGRMQE